jgi:hypothetical protein
VKLEAGGQVCEESRLSPEQMVSLLRHLAVLEKNGTASDLAPTVPCKKDCLVFAHFSVREYLTTPGYMASAIRPSFAIELKQAHFDVASSCIAYLLRTNSLEERKNEFPLREYAWDLWALHAVFTTKDTAIETSNHAQGLYEQVTFGSGYDIPEYLQPIVWWAGSKPAVLDCLRNPYFFEEYSVLDNLTTDQLMFLLYEPLDVNAQMIWLLHIVPNRHRFAGVRCKMIHTSLDESQRYEAISYISGEPIARKSIWLNGSRFDVPAKGQASLRAIRKSSLQGQLVWTDAICIDQRNVHEISDQLGLVPSIFASAVSVTITLEDASESEVWALEIIRLVGQVLERHSDNLSTDLSKLLRSRRSTDPFACMRSLFERRWWSRSWVLQEAVLGKNPVLLYGVHALPWASLQNFVSLADHAFQLISSASPNSGYDPAVLENTVQWENVLSLVRIRAQQQCGIKPRSITQLLYASRYLRSKLTHDRFYCLYALIPPGAPKVNYALSWMEAFREFCSYALLLTKNLDLFTLFSDKSEIFARMATLEQEIHTTWADSCDCSLSMDIPRPLLYHELVEETDGPFRAGGREFRQAPAIHQHNDTLHLEGFLIDTIVAMHDTPTNSRNDQAQLDHKGYSKFSRRRRWFRTADGLAVLGPEQAPVGAVLTILIGGKTPYLLERDHMEAGHFRLVGEWYVNSQSFRDTRHKAAN